MFTRLDKALFSYPCEVFQMETSQGFVFPIFKNGSSTLGQLPHKTLINAQIHRCNEITVYLREPKARFVSGVATYVAQLKAEDPTLDLNTIMYFVKNFTFLNRHFMPQFYWLIALAQYINDDCEFNLRPLSELHDLTDIHVNHTSNNIDEQFKRDVLQTLDLDHYLKLDQVLLDKVGTKIRWDEFFADYRNNDPHHYNSIFPIAERMSRVLPSS